MRFSNETGCFYPESQNYTTLPSDLQTVPDADYDLVQNRALGKLYRAEAGRMVIYDPPPLSLDELKEFYCTTLDDHSEVARQAAIVNDHRTIEYEYTAQAAVKFKEANYEGTVPAAVDSWAAASGKTPQEACDDILERRDLCISALLTIRDQRLRGKAEIRSKTTEAEVIAEYDTYVEIIDAIRDVVANV